MTGPAGIGPDTVAAYLDHLERADHAGAVRLVTDLLDGGRAAVTAG